MTLSPRNHFSPLPLSITHLILLYICPLLPMIPCGLQSFIRLLVSLCFLPSPVKAAWFRVGVVGPWGCDPLFAKALPHVAAQLAVNRINRDPSLSYAATFDYIVLQVLKVVFNKLQYSITDNIYLKNMQLFLI